MNEVTEIQMDQMRHALGLNYGDKQTRNYFYTCTKDREWNDLVEKGLATKRPGWDDTEAYYYLTKKGIEVAKGLEESK